MRDGMRYYRMANYRSYRVFGQTIEPEDDLVGRTWLVADEDAADDSRVVFERDGTLRQTTGETVVTGRWIFEQGVRRMQVELDKRNFVCMPVMFDDVLLAFEAGPGEVAFLIDAARQHAFAPRSLTQLTDFLKKHERRGLEAVAAGKLPAYKLYQSFFSTVDWEELQRRYRQECERREARLHAPRTNVQAALVTLALAAAVVAYHGFDRLSELAGAFLALSAGLQLTYGIGLAAVALLVFAIARMLVSGTTFSTRWLDDFAGSCKRAYLDAHPYLSARQVQQISAIRNESFEREIR